MRTVLTWILLAGVTLLTPRLAAALDYRFSGVVTSVAPGLSSEFHVGEVFSGQMRIEPRSSSSDVAFYAVNNFTANIGGDYPLSSNQGSFKVLNDFGGSIDQSSLEISTPLGLSAPAVAFHTPEYLTFNLLYLSSGLTSTGLLPQFIFGSIIDRSNLRFDGDDSLEVRFSIKDFSVVPEPCSSTLALLGCFFVATLRIWRARASSQVR